MSAARNFQLRARVERGSNFEIENITLKQNSAKSFTVWQRDVLPPLKIEKLQNLVINNRIYSLNMLLGLTAKYFSRAPSERKENFMSASLFGRK